MLGKGAPARTSSGENPSGSSLRSSCFRPASRERLARTISSGCQVTSVPKAAAERQVWTSSLQGQGRGSRPGPHGRPKRQDSVLGAHGLSPNQQCTQHPKPLCQSITAERCCRHDLHNRLPAGTERQERAGQQRNAASHTKEIQPAPPPTLRPRRRRRATPDILGELLLGVVEQLMGVSHHDAQLAPHRQVLAQELYPPSQVVGAGEQQLRRGRARAGRASRWARTQERRAATDSGLWLCSALPPKAGWSEENALEGAVGVGGARGGAAGCAVALPTCGAALTTLASSSLLSCSCWRR